MVFRKKRKIFLKNESAVLGLPLRLTVSLIVGTLVLVAILSMILNPCLFPSRILVTITPQVTLVQGNSPENVSFTVFVNDTDGFPLSGASVIIKGLGGAGSGVTDDHGKVLVQLAVQLESGTSEGYLDVTVKAVCHVPFEHQGFVKVVRRK